MHHIWLGDPIFPVISFATVLQMLSGFYSWVQSRLKYFSVTAWLSCLNSYNYQSTGSFIPLCIEQIWNVTVTVRNDSTQTVVQIRY